jgi:hypothetical protein
LQVAIYKEEDSGKKNQETRFKKELINREALEGELETSITN